MNLLLAANQTDRFHRSSSKAMLRRSISLRCSASATASTQQQQQQHRRVKDTFFKRHNPLDDRKRIVVLIDAEHVTVQDFFTAIQPVIKSNFSSGTHNVLLHRVFAHNLKRDWQNIVLNREEAFDHFKVERFIAMHMQIVADAAHIAQRRLQNKTQGVVLCCAVPSAPLMEEQLRKRDIFAFVDRCVINAAGTMTFRAETAPAEVASR